MKVLHNTTLILITLLLNPQLLIAADNFQTSANGALYKDLKTGSGEFADSGDIVTIHFTGWLDDNGTRGKEIYNTHREHHPISFVVGTDRIMPGWNEGVIGMQPGGKRLLKIPPALAYGAKGVENVIPPNAALIFIIELTGLEKQVTR